MPPDPLFNTAFPLIQAPMAGVQGSAMAIAVCNAGALGSLPCAMLNAESLRRELSAITAQTANPYNVNFFCHAPAVFDAAREAAWKASLAPYYTSFKLMTKALSMGQAAHRLIWPWRRCWPNSNRRW